VTGDEEDGAEGQGRPEAPARAIARAIGEPVRRLPRRARVQARVVVRRRVPVGAREAFRVDLTAMLLAGLYTGAVFPFVNLIARENLHASPQVLAAITAAPFLGNLFALFWARAMEGRRKVPFVKWSHITARTSVLLMAFASSAWAFAAVISAAQIIGTVATPAYAAVIKEVYPDEQRGRIMSLTRAALLSAQIAATFAAGWALSEHSYRYVFPAAALVGIAAAIVFSRINPREGEGAETPEPVERAAAARLRDTLQYLLSTFRILREDHAFRWFALSVFTYGFGNLLMMPIIPLIQVDRLHMNSSDLSWMAIAGQVVAVVAYFHWGRYIDLRSPQRAVVVSILLNAVIPFVYMTATNYWMLLPAFLIAGITNAGIDLSYFAAILSFANEQTVSRYQALQSFLLGIRGSIAPFAGGALAGFLNRNHLDLRYAFAIALLFIIAGCWMQVVAMRRQMAGEPRPA
jgi:MFS family permease